MYQLRSMQEGMSPAESGPAPCAGGVLCRPRQEFRGHSQFFLGRHFGHFGGNLHQERKVRLRRSGCRRQGRPQDHPGGGESCAPPGFQICAERYFRRLRGNPQGAARGQGSPLFRNPLPGRRCEPLIRKKRKILLRGHHLPRCSSGGLPQQSSEEHHRRAQI